MGGRRDLSGKEKRDKSQLGIQRNGKKSWETMEDGERKAGFWGQKYTWNGKNA